MRNVLIGKIRCVDYGTEPKALRAPPANGAESIILEAVGVRFYSEQGKPFQEAEYKGRNSGNGHKVHVEYGLNFVFIQPTKRHNFKAAAKGGVDGMKIGLDLHRLNLGSIVSGTIE